MAKRSTLQRSGQAMIFNFLINEVLASQVVPHYMFWVVAPWVTNFRLPTPYHVSFAEVIATRHESLHLFDVLYQMAMNGGHVHIVVGSDRHYHDPLRRLAERNERISVRMLDDLHAKAYIGYYGALDGSFNLTGSGVSQNIELYNYCYDDRGIAELRQKCQQLAAQSEAL